MKTGEELDVNVTFPAEYQAEELAGKEATLPGEGPCRQGRRCEPKLDDEFAKDVSEFETLAALRERAWARSMADRRARTRPAAPLKWRTIWWIRSPRRWTAEIPRRHGGGPHCRSGCCDCEYSQQITQQGMPL